MNITLGTEFECRIVQKVESGLYTSANEVIRDGLRLLFENGHTRERQADLLREEVPKGFMQIDSGHYSNNTIADILQKALEKQRPTIKNNYKTLNHAKADWLDISLKSIESWGISKARQYSQAIEDTFNRLAKHPDLPEKIDHLANVLA